VFLILMNKITSQLQAFLSHRGFQLGTLSFFVLSLLSVGFLSFDQPLNTFYDAHSLASDYDYPSLTNVYDMPIYTTKMKDYLRLGLGESQLQTSLSPDRLTGTAVDEASPDAIYLNQTYPSALLLSMGDTVSWTHTFNTVGLSYLALDYLELETNFENPKISLLINGEIPFYEAQTLTLPSTWVFQDDAFQLDRYGNELQPASDKVQTWHTSPLRDLKGLHPGYFGFQLEEGDIITLQSVNARLLLGAVHYITNLNLPTYEDYVQPYASSPQGDALTLISARSMVSRSDPSIRLRTEQDPNALAYDTQSLMLNTIFGDSWQTGGQTITYALTVPKTGLYQLTLKYRQYLLNDLPTFRNVYINGDIPFLEMESYAFPFSMAFVNRTFTQSNGDPFLFYLTEGSHTVSLEAVNYPYRRAIETLQYLMSEIQQLSLQIKRYTAGGTDLYRDWDIETYFPMASEDMLSWATLLEATIARLSTLSTIDRPAELTNMFIGVDRLKRFADDINRLPSLMVQFSDGDSSVNQMMGALLQIFLRPSLEIERLVLSDTSQTIPSASSTFWHSTYEGSARLIYSFINNPYSIQVRDDEALNVWVNHPRPFIEIMQALIDQNYRGNRKVNLSQMPDQNKLILANVSGKSPDVALGVDHWIPYDFASRDAALDLRTFDNFGEVASDFTPGAFIPYVFEEGVYGLPETQNFWVTYYRRDILASIGLNDIPQTWDEIIGILPLLQSYGMNYFSPLSQFSGLKPFVATLPFIYQFGGDLYAEDGLTTAINSEKTLQGMTLMSELFTLYNVPKFVASFYNQFRYGTLPIGIGDLGTYLLLSSAAPELEGLWDMDLHPGVLDPETNEINRSAASGAQGSMILSSTEYADDSWDFLSWWMSTEIQSQFAFVLTSTYGKTYLWNTANLNAFATLPIPQQYKDVILAQWEYATEASRIPGAYMVEREISNAWTNIVFNGTNPRQALDEAVRISNREILYKMEEFGYALNGVPLKPYPVPTLATILAWLVAYE
jgi:ABC-type glycerol-3-phosphate transport system substrate-binding protein